MPRRAHDSSRGRGASRAELEEVTEEAPGSQTATRPIPKVISVENVSLSFDEPVLENISFTARAGETIVVVGESGTGKSTILKLLLRLLIPDQGRVAIDGEEIGRAHV